ncbi:sugar nucleotide-binding protein [Carnobacteriaceae bacterium zg-ZUI78]|uniref:SDR family oxidoreductase n=1 Tax=Granulicatella sp. zg-84 TaxID=2678503 RepID=UPI0013C0AD69|nr:sugar nucleotide-binding protein [Granulicatella sp. zg-84]MBS4749974.1 sugar nucleotide-binding protein [Carnobacteriaceae bacterium zg-ZUI78]NEW66172.1 sugar nucleotide-binding protein [Granulicatella sp. zg-84]QMI86071.1 sugar nucleotide-binding protein [Carnobacteriaceae bacterium zg-84]
MTILITDSESQIGKELQNYFRERKIEFLATDKINFDATNEILVNQFIEDLKPEIIYHCTEYTCDDILINHLQYSESYHIDTTRYIASAASRIGAKMVYLSSSFVFDGQKEIPYLVDDMPNPQCKSGMLAYEGELAVRELVECAYIIRTSTVFGEYDPLFQDLSFESTEPREVFIDLPNTVQQYTWSKSVVEFMVFLVENGADYGVYHFANRELCKKDELVQTYLSMRNMSVEIVNSENAHDDEFPILDISKSENLSFYIPTWKESVMNMWKEISD